MKSTPFSIRVLARKGIVLPVLLCTGTLFSLHSSVANAQAPVKETTKPEVTKTDTVKDDTAYTLKSVFTKGEKIHYRMTIKATSADQKQAGTGTIMVLMAQKITNISDNLISLNTIFEQGSLKTDATEMDITTMLPAVNWQINDKGSVIKIEADGGAGPLAGSDNNQLQMFLSTQTNYLPTTPVKVGDSWEYDYALPGRDTKAEKKQKKAKASLLGKETIKGIETLKIKTEVEAELPKDSSMGGGNVKVSGINYVNAKTAQPVKTDTSIVGVGGAMKGMSLNLNLELVTDAEYAAQKAKDDVKKKE